MAGLQSVTFETKLKFEDTDHDGMPDDWEMLYFETLARSAEGNVDGDELRNIEEFNNGTNPTVAEEVEQIYPGTDYPEEFS